jgi:hypothetical protein
MDLRVKVFGKGADFSKNVFTKNGYSGLTRR